MGSLPLITVLRLLRCPVLTVLRLLKSTVLTVLRLWYLTVLAADGMIICVTDGLGALCFLLTVESVFLI